MLSLLLLLALTPVPQAPCVDPAAPLSELIRHSPLPPTVDQKANRLVAAALAVGGKVPVWRALKRLEDVQKRRHDDLAVHLAYGLMQSVFTDLMPEGSEGYRHRRVYDNSNAEAQVVRHLERAAAIDPGQWLAGVTLARVAVGIRSADLLGRATSVLRQQLRQDPASPPLLIALADMLLAQNRPGEALEVLGAIADGCAAAGPVRAEAHAQLGRGDTAGALYLAALRAAGHDQLYRFYDDARVLFTQAQRTAFRQGGADERRRLLVEFWEASAAAAGVVLEERVAIHLRRLQYAHDHFRLTRSTGRGDRPEVHIPIERAFHDDDVPWDARGATYVRHGPPDRIVATSAGAILHIPLNATWVYFENDRARLVHFAQPQVRGDPLGWYIVATTFAAGCAGVNRPWIANQRWAPASGGLMSGPRPMTRIATDDVRERGFGAGYYFDRAAYEPDYAALGVSCASGGYADILINNMDRAYRADVTALLTSEDGRKRYPRALWTGVAAYEFRDAAMNPALAAMAWIRFGGATDPARPDTLRLRLTVADSAHRPLQYDTIISLGRSAAPEGAVLRLVRYFSATGLGRATVRSFAEASDSVGGSASIRIAANEEASRRLSDVVIAEPELAGPLVRGRTRLSPLPGHRVPTGVPFRVYFEVYGVADGEPLRTTITVRREDERGARDLARLFKGRSARRELRFDEPVAVVGHAAVRDVTVSGDLVPGDYEIEVVVSGQFGTAKRTARLRVGA